MGKGNNAVSGYDYYIGLHFGISHGPIDNFLELRGGNLTAWTGNVTASGAIQINFPTLYGGSTREGGLLGQLDIMMGEPTQMPNAYLTAQQGNPQPAYRGTCTVVYEGGLIGSNNPYPKPWAFRIRRVLKGWFNNAVWEPTLATVPLSNGAIGMNPAHIVYEVITNPDWGMGYPASQIDTANFLIAATQLQAEGTGLCLLWNRQDTIENFLQTLMDYMAAVLVSSPTTGLFQLNLIRGGYDIATLPVFTQDDVIELSSKEDSSITGCTNEMVVKFFDPINKINQICTLQALGAIQAQRVVVSTVKEYPGIATMDLASRVAFARRQATDLVRQIVCQNAPQPGQPLAGRNLRTAGQFLMRFEKRFLHDSRKIDLSPIARRGPLRDQKLQVRAKPFQVGSIGGIPLL